MLSNEIIDFTIENIREKYNLQTAVLTEKTIAEKKVKFKFEKGSLKFQMEFGNNDLAGIIYNNFLDESQTENVTVGEFQNELESYLELNDVSSKESLKTTVDRIISELRSRKLFNTQTGAVS